MPTPGTVLGMRWAKAVLVFAISVVVAYLAYGVTDNLAVPTAVVLSGLVFTCMAFALDTAGQAPAQAERRRFHAGPEGRPVPRGAVRPDPDADAWRAAARRRVAGTR